jgi:hypothetical protein
MKLDNSIMPLEITMMPFLFTAVRMSFEILAVISIKVYLLGCDAI